MNPIIAILLFTSSSIIIASSSSSSVVSADVSDSVGHVYYQDWKESVDVEPVLRNDKLLNGYIRCFMNSGGPCTNDQRKVLKMIPELMETMFAKCTPKQKAMAQMVLRYVYNNRRKDFDRLVNKFDPDRKYYNKIMDFMK